tara:strand:- start:198 stop:3890 length:3693 start_codon:yes stop_codon:yes gene_type:complete
MINRANLLKHYFLLSLAALDDEIAKLESAPEIIDYLKSITDNKIKGQVFNFVKSKKPQFIQEVQAFETDLLSKLDQKKGLQESILIYNQLKSDKMKMYFKELAKRKKLIVTNDLLDKFNKIEYFVRETLKDTDITDYDFDDLYNAAIKWEESLDNLDDEITGLNSSLEIIDYLKNISDKKIRGRVFKFIKSKNPESIEEVKAFEANLLSKSDQEKNLQELMLIYNELKSDKIKKYFTDLVKRKKLTAHKDLLDKFNKVEHFVQENFKDTDITDYDFDKLYNASVKWEESFKQVKEVKINLDPSRIVYGPNWKKNEFNGHFIYELKTKEELTKEGSDLNHCVAGYAIYVEQGVKRIFSLRTSSNKPLLTIETSPDMFLFKQTFGFNNSSPNQIQSNMVNEWKQSLHPKEEIIELTESYDYEDKIQAAQFMDYNDPDYKNIIDKFVTEGKDSGKGYIGSQTANNPKDILQALSSNETLHEDLYDSIYMKAIKNYSTVHNLILNPSIHNDLYKMIYFKHDLNYDLKNTFCESRKLAENEDVLKGLLQEKQFAYNIRILNNPSIKSSTCISIINSLSDDDINHLFSYDEFNNYEPKLIDDLLNSKIDIKQHLVELIKYPNLSKDCLLKLYNLYKIKPILVTKEELLSEIFEIDKFLYLNYSNLSESSVTDEQLVFLIKTDETQKLISLSKSPYLTVDQINRLLNAGRYGSTEIMKNLSSNPNLTKDQVLFIIRSPGYYNDLTINDNQDILRLALENKSGTLLNANLNHSDKEFDDLLNKYRDEDFSLIGLCNNYHLNNYKIQRLLDLNNIHIHHSLGRNKFLHKDQINFLLNSSDKNIKYVLDNLKYNPDLNEEQVSILLDKYPHDKSSDNAASYAGKLPNEVFISLFKKPKSSFYDDYIYDNLSKNINLTELQINMLLDIGDMSGYENQSKLLKAINERSSVVSENLAKNPNLNSKHIDKLLEQGSLKTKEYLSENKNIKFNDLQFNQLLNEADQLAYNPNLTKEQCLKIIDKKPIALSKYFGYHKKASQNYQFKSLAYYQGTEEPTPGKKQYKSDKAIVVQPRFKEPFYKNYDLYETGGEHSPGAGWHHIMKYKSIKEFLDAKRKNKYKADDSWIEDNGTVSKKARNLFFLNILIKNGIDFPIDDQITSMPIKEVNQIGGYLDKYLPENDSENKSPDKLNFGILEDEFSKENHKFLGLPDGIEPDEDLDADSTDTVNPEYGTTNSGNTLYNI